MNRAQRRAQWIAHKKGAEPRNASPVLLHIEELVLHGFSADDRYGIGEAVQQELTYLFSMHGVPPSLAKGGYTERVDAGSFNVAKRAKAHAIGTQVAQAVYGATKQ